MSFFYFDKPSFSDQRFKIPEELYSGEHYPNDVSIIVGENGSGKSTSLHLLSNLFINQKKNVIAIANSVHDKFDSKNKKIKILRGRSGRKLTKTTILNSLKNIAEGDIQKLKNATRALEYVGFTPAIGIELKDLRPDYENRIRQASLNTYFKADILDTLNVLKSFQNNDQKITWLRVDSLDFSDSRIFSLTRLFLYSFHLKKLGIIGTIEIYLEKKDRVIPILKASSGELSLITSIIYITTAIDENTVILIDEPENSLHPIWQKEYTKVLFDLFYYYQPKVIIATHSPLIVNGAELFIEESKIYKLTSSDFERQRKEPLNVEEIYFRFFDITTPKNRFLSDILVRYLNILAAGRMSTQQFNIEVNRIKDKVYDPSQLEVLDKIKDLARAITDFNNN